MKPTRIPITLPGAVLTSLLAACGLILLAQTPEAQRDASPKTTGHAAPPPQAGPGFDPPPFFGPGGFSPPGSAPFGPGGPGGMMGEEAELVRQFDLDKDKRLNAEERKAARAFLQEQSANRPGRGGPGGMGGRRGGPPGFPGSGQSAEPAAPGARLTPADVASYPGVPFYDAQTLRTLFLEFENDDWERELADFKDTDVEVPARLIVDGRNYEDVGVRYRGATSYRMVPEGRKRPLNLSLDFVHQGQAVGGYRTLNLLNAHQDPTFMRTVLALDIAREHFPAPKANFVRLVINGESWGVYVSAQQFNTDFIQDEFDTRKGARWKVEGSPGGRGGFSYLGDDVEAYRRIYTIKSKDDPESWAALITLCKTLETTPPDRLEQALQPMLDIEGTLRFLAWDNALVNGDGFWTRASDYNLYRDVHGRFHLIPHDVNETFSAGGGPGGPGGFRPGGFGPGAGPEGSGGGVVPLEGMRAPGAVRQGQPGSGGPGLGAPGFNGPGGGNGEGRPGQGGRGFGGPGFGRAREGPGSGGVELDPLVAAQDPTKPLLSKLLAVPALRARYLGYIRQIAQTWLDWDRLGARVREYAALIEDAVKADTRKLDTFEAFQSGITDDAKADELAGPSRSVSLKSFAHQRRAYLLNAVPPPANP